MIRPPPTLTSGHPITVATRERTYSAVCCRFMPSAGTVWFLSIANSSSANNPCTNGSSFNGRVTDEYRTGTPS